MKFQYVCDDSKAAERNSAMFDIHLYLKKGRYAVKHLWNRIWPWLSISSIKNVTIFAIDPQWLYLSAISLHTFASQGAAEGHGIYIAKSSTFILKIKLSEWHSFCNYSIMTEPSNIIFVVFANRYEIFGRRTLAKSRMSVTISFKFKHLKFRCLKSVWPVSINFDKHVHVDNGTCIVNCS